MKKVETKEIRELRDLRQRSGMTYEQIARQIGVSSMTVYHWLKRNQRPSAMARQLIRSYLMRAKID